MKRVIVTGSGGQLGREFQVLASDFKQLAFSFYSRSEGDISSLEFLKKLEKSKADVIINCAAYTAVDKAESERKKAKEINADAVGRLGELASKIGSAFIHFSSDYVYHNNRKRPQRETDPTRPKSVYAKTKLRGEKLLTQMHQFPLIFRVSWLYSTFGHNFPKTMLRLGAEKAALNVVSDQVGAPTYAKDLAHTVLQIVDKMNDHTDWSQIKGIYNYCNSGTTNWAEMASFIMSHANLSCQINPIPSTQYPTPAARPRNSRLDLTKFSRIFGMSVPSWQSSMVECLDLLLTSEDGSK